MSSYKAVLYRESTSALVAVPEQDFFARLDGTIRTAHEHWLLEALTRAGNAVFVPVIQHIGKRG